MYTGGHLDPISKPGLYKRYFKGVGNLLASAKLGKAIQFLGILVTILVVSTIFALLVALGCELFFTHDTSIEAGTWALRLSTIFWLAALFMMED